jgi:hypothetical protein
MTTYFVATLARYVLVNAETEARARELGRIALRELYADRRERTGGDVPIQVLTVRPATREEIQLGTWHQEMVAREQAMKNSSER